MDSIPARLAEALSGRYTLLRQIGAGGAALVYLADDLKHDRRVALKVLRPDLAQALGPERFEDEIRIAARLHHPHILPVHDSGEAGGYLYYVMPFVEGQSLRERMNDGQPFAPGQVAKLLAEVADALSTAHAAGIVHRDIKPENIMLSGRHAVVTDFGIAKAISAAGDRKSLTSLGLALGTPAYMAPEQATADPALDHRADVYALGVVGYEMLAGRPPFSGSPQEVLAAHTVTPPTPLSALRPDLDPALAGIVMRALAKSPADRWPSAEAMQAQLESLGSSTHSGVTATVVLPASNPTRTSRPRQVAWLAGAGLAAAAVLAWTMTRAPAPVPVAAPTAVAMPPSTPVRAGIPDLAVDPSIAVLRFENMSSDAEQEYFSDGITEELLNLLAKVPRLRVIARTSSFAYTGKDVGVAQIGRELHVATVLEGSVRKSGDKVRITVQLVRASDGTQLWSEAYDRTLEDIFNVQDEIATAVVAKLRGRLLGDATVPAARPVDPRVYPLSLRAQALLNSSSRQGRSDALVLLQQAVKIAPEEPRVWLQLARTYVNQASFFDNGDPAQDWKKARQATERTLALDPGAAVAYTHLARILQAEGKELQAVVDLYARALTLAPSDPGVLGGAATMLSSLGRDDEALALRRWLIARDPANPSVQANYCRVSTGVAPPSETIAACQVAIALSPAAGGLHGALSEAYFLSGRIDDALREARLEPDAMDGHLQLGRIYVRTGRTREAQAEFDLFSGQAPLQVDTAIHLAYDHRLDEAFALLDEAMARDPAEIKTLFSIRRYRRLFEHDSRWQPLLRRIGMDEAALTKVRFVVAVPG